VDFRSKGARTKFPRAITTKSQALINPWSFNLPMLKKSFVSISFASPKKIQVVKLTSSKKSVQKYISVDLPESVIQNLRVKDVDALAKILKEIWKKVGLKEKSVGIVIPESLTYTKLLKLPNLPSSELDEAVRWQAFEYLPHSPQDLILDWKIVGKDEGEVTVLIVAILKEDLGGYVKSAHLAGLYPLVVETPSLSLIRFSDSKETGTIFVYESFGEVIILISKGQSIIASSVVNIEAVEEAIIVVNQMIKHYSQVSIEQIVVGGPKMSQVIANKLKGSIGKEPVWIKPNVTGIDANSFQEYIIAISQQLKDPAEPSDETTVNLLPPELVKKYQREKIKHQIWSLSLFVTLVVWILFFTTLGVYMFMGMEAKSLKGEDVLNQIPPEKAEYIAQIEEINKVSNKVLAITKAQVYPEAIFNSINGALPQGVSILRYRLNMETGVIEVIGISSSRQLLIDFKERLEENVDFSLVHIPISSFEKESNLDYVASFSYLPKADVKIKR